MSQYRTGKVFVTNGSNLVYGNVDTNWTSIAAGHWFALYGSDITYNVASVTQRAHTYFSAYAAGTTYALGDRVASAGKIYVSLFAGNLAHTPESSPTYWAESSGWEMSLTTNFSGATAVNKLYGIVVDFTEVYSFPLPSTGDIEMAAIIARALSSVEDVIAAGGLMADTRRSWGLDIDDTIGDFYGMEQLSAAQSGDYKALRIVGSSQNSSYIAFGKYTNETAFTEFARFTNAGNLTLNLGLTTASLYAPTGTDLTLGGGSSGASLVLGQGSNGSITLTPKGSGGVGIGTSSPQSKLDLRGNYTALSGVVTAPIFNIFSTNAAGVDIGGTLQFSGETGNGTTPYGFAAIKGAKESAAANDYAGYLSLWTVAGSGGGGSNSAIYERARITSLGNVLIGGTTDISGSGGLKVFGTTDASGTATGALQVLGGAYIAKEVYLGADLHFPAGGYGLAYGSLRIAQVLSNGIKIDSTTASTSTSTGSLINSGGFGNAGNVYIGGIIDQAATSGGNRFRTYTYFIDKELFLTRTMTQDWGLRAAETTGNLEIVDWTSTLTRFSLTPTGNLSLTAAAATLTMGSTNTASIAVAADGGLTVTPKAGQYLTLAAPTSTVLTGFRALNSGGSDGVILGFSGSAYAGGILPMTGTDNPFLYFPANKTFTIGTDAPLLRIVGSTGAATFASSISLANASNITFAYPGDPSVATGRLSWWSGSNVGVSIGQTSANTLTFQTSGSTVLTLGSTGIATFAGSTTVQGGALEIDGSANAVKTLYLSAYGLAAGNFSYLRSSTLGFEISTFDSSAPLRLQQNGGRVGIGVDPEEKLHVDGKIKIGQNGTVGTMMALTPTYWGYGNSYKVVMIADSGITASIGYNPVNNPNGSFSGDGREMLFRRGIQFVTPNAADDGYYLSNLVLKDGNVGIGTTAPNEKLEVAGAGLFTAQLANYRTSSTAIDFYSGVSRIWAFGPDAATAGTLKLIVSASDGSPTIERLTLGQSDSTFAAGDVNTLVIRPATGSPHNTLAIQTGDYAVGTAGTGLYIGLNATSGDTYARFQASKTGSSAATPITFQQDGGNVLVGTSTDSSNGRLQLATHTTSAGGIGFGTDTSLYRYSGAALALKSTGDQTYFSINDSVGQKFLMYVDTGTATLMTTTAKSLILGTNATTALTLDASQNATFSGSATASYFITSGSQPGGLGANKVILDYNSSTGRIFTYGPNNSTVGQFDIRQKSADESVSYTHTFDTGGDFHIARGLYSGSTTPSVGGWIWANYNYGSYLDIYNEQKALRIRDNDNIIMSEISNGFFRTQVSQSGVKVAGDIIGNHDFWYINSTYSTSGISGGKILAGVRAVVSSGGWTNWNTNEANTDLVFYTTNNNGGGGNVAFREALRLDYAQNARFAGGGGFGGHYNISSFSGRTVTLNVGAGNNGAFELAYNGSAVGYMRTDSGSFGVQSNGVPLYVHATGANSIIFQTYSTTALTLDASQKTALASSLRVGGATNSVETAWTATGYDGHITFPDASLLSVYSEISGAYRGGGLMCNVARDGSGWKLVDTALPAWRVYFGSGASSDYFAISRSPATTLAEVDFFKITSAGNATFAGNVGFANTNVVAQRLAGEDAWQFIGSGAYALKIWNNTNVDVGGDLTVSGGNVGVGGSVNAAYGVYVQGSSLSGASQYGLASQVTYSSAATSAAYGIWSKVTLTAANFTCASVYGAYIQAPTLQGASAATNVTGLYVNNQGGGGVTNAIGVDIAAQSGALGTNLSLRAAGRSLFGGTADTNADGYSSVVIQSDDVYTQAQLYNSDTTNSDINSYLSLNRTGSACDYGAGDTNPGLNLWTSSYHPLRLGTNGAMRMVISKTGITTFSNATAATSNTTGALVVTGGVGIGGNLYSGSIVLDSTSYSSPFIGTTSGSVMPLYFRVDGAHNVAYCDLSYNFDVVNSLYVGSKLAVGGASYNAYLTLPAGGTAANTAPLRFTTQASGLSTVEQGAMELIGNSLQFTQFAKRRGVAMSQSTRTSTTTIGPSDSAESAALITAEHGANYLEVGKMEEILITGTITQRNNASATCSFRIKYAGATIQTVTSPASTAISAIPFELRIYCTVRSTGASGTMQINSILEIAGNVVDNGTVSAPVTIDTTTAQNTTVTAQWNESNAGNTLVVHQGRVLCIEPNK